MVSPQPPYTARCGTLARTTPPRLVGENEHHRRHRVSGKRRYTSRDFEYWYHR